MTESEAVTRARQWIPLHRENRYQKEAAKIMTRLLADYDELVAEVERLHGASVGLASTLAETFRDLRLSRDAHEENQREWSRVIDEHEVCHAERDQLKATVERVRALCSDTGNSSTGPAYVMCAEVLAALDGDDQSGDPKPGGPWTRHGHVIPGVTVDGPGRPAVARCGGPGLCAQCARDAAQHQSGDPS